MMDWKTLKNGARAILTQIEDAEGLVKDGEPNDAADLVQSASHDCMLLGSQLEMKFAEIPSTNEV